MKFTYAFISLFLLFDTASAALQVDTFSSSSVVNSLAIADGLIDGSIPNNGTASASADFIDYFGGFNFSGNFTNNLPFPGDFEDFFALHMLCVLEIPANGSYIFISNNDDGLRLRIDDVNIILDDSNHGARNFFGEVFLSEGVHDLDLVFFENIGDATLELFAASFSGGSGGGIFQPTFSLIGDVANGGLACNSPDTLVDTFNFTDESAVTLSSTITSNVITISGINAPATISVVGGSYSIDSGAFTTSPGIVLNGQTVTVQHTSAETLSTVTDTTLTIGVVSDTFSSTTFTMLPSFTIEGTVSGLEAGNTVVLQNNVSGNITVNAVSDNGSTTFDTLEDGSTYSISVLNQPTTPNQICTVSNGSGTLDGANISDVTVDCSQTCNLDIDGDGGADALTDGLLFIRHMFGIRDESLIVGAVAGDCAFCAAAEIELILDQCVATGISDIDGDGNVDALTDGLLVIRYIFGIRGEAMITNSIGNDCSRCTANEIEGYLQGLMP